jgi:spore maturation protein CgeB
VEYEDYGSEGELIEKARFYLAHEEARAKIARAYYDRTMAEHLWQYRFEAIFRSIRGG